MKKYDIKNGFSIAEMMIALLVISIIMAASMPIITKRSKSSVDKTWTAATNGSDAYFGLGATQGIAVGTSTFPNGKYAKFLLNTENSTNTTISHMLFSSTDGGILAKLRFAPTQFEFGNNAVAESDNATAIGHNTNAGTNSTAIGANATANNTNSTALGYLANAGNTGSIAIGYNANTTSYFDSIAIGRNANVSTGDSGNVTGNHSVAVGTNANAMYDLSTAIGDNAKAKGSKSVALGSSTLANSEGALAAGYYAQATGNYTIALGYNATAVTDNSIALGLGADTSDGSVLKIGDNLISVDSSKALNLGVNSSTVSSINLGSGSTGINLNGVAYNSSDIRKKDIIGEYKSGLDDIMKLKTYEFTYKDDTKKIKRVGVIAQELQTVFPNAVKKDDDGFLSIRKEDMFYAVINAIKEISLKITALQKENLKLKHQVEELSKRVEALENAKVK